MSLRAQRALNNSSDQASRSMERLASGQRINHPSDDAAGLSILATLNAETRIGSIAMRNVNDGISMINIADSALGSITNILQRIAELSEQAANGVYSMPQRSVIELEVQALASEIERVATIASFNNIRVLSGTSAVILQVGFDSLSTSQIQVGGASGTLQALRLASVGSSQFFHTVLGNSTDEAIRHSRTLLAAATEAIGLVAQTRSNFGANENRLNSALHLLETQRENSQAAAGRIKDLNIAEEVSKLIQQQILQQTGAAVLAQANLQPRLVLQLLA